MILLCGRHRSRPATSASGCRSSSSTCAHRAWTSRSFIDGTADFCEVVLDGVRARRPAARRRRRRLGRTRRAGVRRGGPDRWLSTYLVVEEFLREHESDGSLPDEVLDLLGTARPATGCSATSRCRSPDRSAGGSPSIEASLVKEMGALNRTCSTVLAVVDRTEACQRSLLEQLLVCDAHWALVHDRGANGSCAPWPPRNAAERRPAMSVVVPARPSIRSSWRRSTSARRAPSARSSARRPTAGRAGVDALAASGFPWISLARTSAGRVARSLMRWPCCAASDAAAPVPVRRPVCSAAGSPRPAELPDGPITVVPDLARSRSRVGGSGRATVAWKRPRDHVLAVVQGADAPLIVSAPPDGLEIGAHQPGR